MGAPAGEGKRTCVAHVDNSFVQLRRDYHELFESDQCAAQLAWLFEFATDNEMSRKRLAEEDGEPWLTLSVKSIQRELLDTFQERAILARLSFFKANQIIQVDPRGGHDQINRYLFNRDLMSTLLTKRKRLPFDIKYGSRTEPLGAPIAPSEKQSLGAKLSAKLGAKLDAMVAPHNKEEDSIFNTGELQTPQTPLAHSGQKNQTPSQIPSVDLNSEDDAITFVGNVYSRLNRQAKLDNLRARKGEVLCAAIRAGEQEWGPADFRGALVAYLSDQSEWLKEKRWPLQVFLAQVKKYIPQCLPGGLVAERRLPVEAEQKEQCPPSGLVTGTIAGTLPLTMPAPTLPFSAMEWNRIVTAGPPVDQWTHRDWNLNQSVVDPEFIAALPKVLPICQKAFEVQPDEVGWLSFRWLFKRGKTGVENWYSIASGDMNWLRARRGVRPRKPTIVEETLRRNNARLAEFEQQRINAAAAADTARNKNAEPAAATVRGVAGVP